jgi:putative redox protein
MEESPAAEKEDDSGPAGRFEFVILHCTTQLIRPRDPARIDEIAGKYPGFVGFSRRYHCGNSDTPYGRGGTWIARRASMQARVRWVDGASFVVETGSGHSFLVDGAPEVGGRDLGGRPMEVLLAGAAACTAVDVLWILRKARQPVADCVVEAEADRAETIPRVFTRMRLRYIVAGRGLDPHQVERAVKLSKEKYCSATLMLGATVDISVDVAIVEGDRVPTPA